VDVGGLVSSAGELAGGLVAGGCVRASVVDATPGLHAGGKSGRLAGFTGRSWPLREGVIGFLPASFALRGGYIINFAGKPEGQSRKPEGHIAERCGIFAGRRKVANSRLLEEEGEEGREEGRC